MCSAPMQFELLTLLKIFVVDWAPDSVDVVCVGVAMVLHVSAPLQQCFILYCSSALQLFYKAICHNALMLCQS